MSQGEGVRKRAIVKLYSSYESQQTNSDLRGEIQKWLTPTEKPKYVTIFLKEYNTALISELF